MAVRSVQWSSFTKLPCAGCAPSDVILCTTFNLTITARLTNTTTFKNGTGQLVYRYTFLYDIDDDKFPGFTCSNITGVFCRGCMTDWIVEQLTNIINIIPAAPSVFSQTAYQESADFLLNPTPININLFVTNASTQSAMNATLAWGYAQEFQSTVPFDFTGATSQLFIDGSPISNFVNAPAGKALIGVGSGCNEILPAPTGGHSFTLNTGQTSIVTLTITPTPGAIPPDLVWGARQMFITAFGVSV